MQHINKRSKSKKYLVIAALAVVAILAAGAIVWQRRTEQAASTQTDTGDSIRYEPATEEEKRVSEQQKDTIVQNREKAKQEDQNPTPDGKRAVTPIITLAQFSGGTATVQAYVPGIYEEGGSCTATLKNGTNTVSKQSAAFANATTTDCQHISIPRSEFPAAGTWSVTVAYTSAAAEGASTQQSTIEVK